MSRIIKFRAWYTRFNRYHEGPTELLWSQHGFREPYPADGTLKLRRTDHEMFNYQPGAYDEYDRNRFTLEQFTGLKDKNGREIYEGDIVQTAPSPGCLTSILSPEEFTIYTNGEIRMSHGSWMICQAYTGAVPLYDFTDCDCCPAWSICVIGNAHENPELLQPNKT